MELVVALLAMCIVYLLIAHSRLQKRVVKLETNKTKTPKLRNSDAEVLSATRETSEHVTTKTPQKPARNPWIAAARNSSDENRDILLHSGAVRQALAASKTPRAQGYLFNGANFATALTWAKVNWFYLIAAASLGLAGLFLVQYGAENGFLPPLARVASAISFGLGLIVLGEYLRRRGGDAEGDLFAYLPSTFAAAGLMSMFAGTLSAHVLYGLIGVQAALVGLCLVGAIAIIIGWFYGPFLALMGILTAILAPFLIGGSPGSVDLFFYYFALIAVVAIAVDTIKRWAWLSGFAALLTFVAASNVFFAAGGGLHFLAFGVIVTLAVLVIPERSVTPRQQGAMVSEVIWFAFRKRVKAPDTLEHVTFPTRLAFCVFAATSLATVWVHWVEIDAFWLTIVLQLGLFFAAAIWMRKAEALTDLAALPLVVLAITVWQESAFEGQTHVLWLAAADRLPETAAPWTLTAILSIGVSITIVTAWRSYSGAAYASLWAAAAAVMTPLIAILLEVFWAPSHVIGADNWAFHVLALAALMVLLTERFARFDQDKRTRTALFALSAMTLIAMAVILMLSEVALTVAMAIMVLASIVLDRRFTLPALNLFAQIGTAVIAWRMVIDPGWDWAYGAPFWEAIGSYGLVLALLWVARSQLLGRNCRITFAVLDGAFWSLSAVTASLIILRMIEEIWPSIGADGHVTFSLIGMVWLVSAANQLWRLRMQDLSKWIRISFAALYAAPGFLALFLATTLFNPLVGFAHDAFGPYILSSLFIAYAIPAFFFLAIAIRFDHLWHWLRTVFSILGISFACLYIALEIRRFWRGDDLSVAGTTDPELYTYTVVMLLVSTGLLFYAFYKRSTWLRKLALAGIGLTVAKVFLIDISGLTGLLRVFSFLVLGFVVAGLAWLDRWFGAEDEAGSTNAE